EVLGVGDPGDHGADEEEGLHPVRMGESVIHGELRAVRAADERGAADLQRIEDGLEVLHVRVGLLGGLGTAEPAAVVADDAEALRQLLYGEVPGRAGEEAVMKED